MFMRCSFEKPIVISFQSVNSFVNFSIIRQRSFRWSYIKRPFMLNNFFIKTPLIQIGVYKYLSKSLSNCFVNEMQFLCISPLYLTLEQLYTALSKQGDVILRICSFLNLPMVCSSMVVLLNL